APHLLFYSVEFENELKLFVFFGRVSQVRERYLVLSFPFVRFPYITFVLEIWAWNARGSFWSLVSTFDIPAAAAPRAVLKLYKNDKLFLEDSKGDLLLYDHATRRLENLRIPIDRRGFSEFFPY
ncbi:Unknown protein, partial [Striga hermonthica]